MTLTSKTMAKLLRARPFIYVSIMQIFEQFFRSRVFFAEWRKMKIVVIFWSNKVQINKFVLFEIMQYFFESQG